MNPEKIGFQNFTKSTVFILTTFVVIVAVVSGFLGSLFAINLTQKGPRNSLSDVLSQELTVVKEESAIIDAAEKSVDSIVSIVITKDVPIFERRSNPFFDFFEERQQIGTEEMQVGSGSGFIISEDGLLITNRHVVEDEEASYTVIFNNADKYSAKVLEKDTLLDIAIMQIDSDSQFVPLQLGTSEDLKVGQVVLAIGNALGEFSNSVSAGIISGLSRNIQAGDNRGGISRLSNVIQTDASINPGNSGGPLLNSAGQVIGVNVAIVQGAENIGFAIPIDTVKDLLQRYEQTGNIKRPTLGVRYAEVSEQLLLDKGLSDYDSEHGAVIVRGGDGEGAIQKDSPAAKAGLRENDIIMEVDGQTIDIENPLFELIQRKFLGDTVNLKVWRNGEVINVEVTL